MIVVTGGLGFIGQNIVRRLISNGFDVKVLDTKTMSINEIGNFILNNAKDIEFIFHMGAISDTTETNIIKLNSHNYYFSIFIWNICASYNISLIYASSAATYGDGYYGFDDSDIYNLKPLNQYAISKQKFDEFAMTAGHKPNKWYGLKFFNVYGFDESSKGKMASMVYQSYNQIKNSGEMKLFRSGEQTRDFIYVDDVVDVCMFFMNEKPVSGIYNVGTGKAQSFNYLIKTMFKILERKENITYVDMPQSLVNQYQSHTQANLTKLRNVGFKKNFYDLEDGITKYVNRNNN